MITTPNHRLLEFIRKLRVDLTPEGSITRFELYHTVDGDQSERLETFEMADRPEDEDPDDLAQEIWNVAEEDAESRPQGSHQRYVVQAYRGDTREPDAQRAFTTIGKLVSSLVGGDTEPPTPRGMVAADMRRTNELHAMLVRVCEHTAVSAAASLDRERQENQRLREMGFQAEKMRQELLDRSNEREIARQNAQAWNQQMQMLTGMLIQFAPLLLQRFLAPPPAPGAAQPLQALPGPQPPVQAPGPGAHPVVAARDTAMAGLLGTVSPEQIQKLMDTFTPEQTQQFLGIYSSYRDHPPAPPSGAPPAGSRTSN